MFPVTQIDPALYQLPTLPPAQASPSASSHSGFHFTFHDFLSIINPLQHLPVIGTLYRAITGDKIGVPEKIAGDALYGGLWGAVSSVADAAFQAITGKDFGDTVLALFTGHHDSSTAVASNDSIKPVPVTPGGRHPRRSECRGADRVPAAERRGSRAGPARALRLSEIHDSAQHGDGCRRAVSYTGAAWI